MCKRVAIGAKLTVPPQAAQRDVVQAHLFGIRGRHPGAQLDRVVQAGDLAAALGSGGGVAEPERQAVEGSGEAEQINPAAPAWRRAASSSLQKVQARRSGLPARAASRRPTATAACSSAATISPETNRSTIIPPAPACCHHKPFP